jgi:hypothetical protein
VAQLFLGAGGLERRTAFYGIAVTGLDVAQLFSATQALSIFVTVAAMYWRSVRSPGRDSLEDASHYPVGDVRFLGCDHGNLLSCGDIITGLSNL